jgi:hypothetical protein
LGGAIKSFLFSFDGHEGCATIIGAIVAGGITWAAMWFIDKENKKRWQKDSFVKYVNDRKIKLYDDLVKAIADSEDFFCPLVDKLSDSDLILLADLYKSLKGELELHKEFYDHLRMKNLSLSDIEEELMHLHLYFKGQVGPNKGPKWFNNDGIPIKCKLANEDDVKKSITLIKEFKDSLLPPSFS